MPSGDAAAFCAGLRPLLESDPEWWRQGMLSDGDSVAVNRALGEAGWIGMSWPVELGGRGLSRLTATLVEEIFGYHWLPLSSYLLSYKTIGAAIERFGSPALVEQLLPPIARGELVFCQGFSEPGAGSDLGSLTTRAELHGDTYVVNGHKIWTSSAQLADWIYLAVRTEPDAKHRGISVLVCPVDTPGIEVRTFPTLGGGYLCETFLDGVEIPATNLVGEVNGGWDILMYTLDFERVTAEKLGGFAWVLDAVEGQAARDGPARPRRLGEDRAAAGRAARVSSALVPGGGHARPRPSRQRDLGDGEALGRAARPGDRGRGDRSARPRRARRRLAGRRDPGSRGGALSRLGRLDDRRRHGRGAAARDRATRTGSPMSLPLEGVRVVEVAQYVAGPLAGSLLAELGADVIKVEPPGGDAYRRVMPVAPGIGRFFVPLNRGKRSVVLDLKTADGCAALAQLVATADVVIHNAPPARAAAFGLEWEALHAAHPALVVGVVTSFGPHGPLAGRPAYDLVAQGRSGLLTSHASHGDTVPVRAGGIPMADLTAGHLLATGVLAALVAARGRGRGGSSRCRSSVRRSPCRSRISSGSTARPAGPAAAATRGDLAARADEIAGGLAMNPYYRCYEAADGFLAVACLNLAQRRVVPRRCSGSRMRRSRRRISCRKILPCSPRSSA